MPHGDQLIQPGAYITDGTGLYAVISCGVAYLGGGASDRVRLEDCKTLQTTEYAAADILRDFRLVRAAPSHSQVTSRVARGRWAAVTSDGGSR